MASDSDMVQEYLRNLNEEQKTRILYDTIMYLIETEDIGVYKDEETENIRVYWESCRDDLLREKI